MLPLPTADTYMHTRTQACVLHKTPATATCLQPMSTKPWPQQRFASRCPQNLSHNNMYQGDVHDTLATITFLESNVRSLCFAISGASRLPYALFSSFPFVMRCCCRPPLPVNGLISGLGGYRVAFTIISAGRSLGFDRCKLMFQRTHLRPNRPERRHHLLCVHASLDTCHLRSSTLSCR